MTEIMLAFLKKLYQIWLPYYKQFRIHHLRQNITLNLIQQVSKCIDLIISLLRIAL